MKITKANGVVEYQLLAQLKQRAGETDPKITEAVTTIINGVKEGGDEAVREYTVRFDGSVPKKIEFDKDEIHAFLDQVDPAFKDAVVKAQQNIYDFHQRQAQQSWMTTKESGVIMGQRIRGLKRVGIYVPGGTAAYPSSVLMNAVPAKIAGVQEIIMVTPPGKDGNPNPNIMAAAAVAGVDKVFLVGGAQAVAALAYGTQRIPKVDKIVGPGNIFVATAKKLLHGNLMCWQQFEDLIPLLERKFCVYAVSFDGFDGTGETTYTTARDQADKLAAYIEKELDGQLDLLFAESLGCGPAVFLKASPTVQINRMILSGPEYLDFGVLNRLILKVMPQKQYRTAHEKYMPAWALRFMGQTEQGMQTMLRRIPDHISLESVRATWEAGLYLYRTDFLVQPDAKVACWYGEKEGHMKKAIQRLRTAYPSLIVRCFPGFGHGEIINHPALLVSEMEHFLADGETVADAQQNQEREIQ